MDAMSDPVVSKVVFKKGSQVAASEAIINIMGYYIDHEPAPMLLFQPTERGAKDFSKDRIAPSIRDSPTLRQKVSDAKSRDGGNTMLHKNFPGGKLVLGGANAPTNLASHPVRIVLFDEVDRYPASSGTEGDPIDLGVRRTQNFWNRKIFQASTPTRKKTSRICISFDESDQRHQYIPCPRCQKMHIIVRDNLVYEEGKPETARLRCPECKELYGTVEKNQAVKLGRWTPHAPFRGTAGFFLPGIYSPWVSLEQAADEWEKAKDVPERRQVVINTLWGEGYEDTTEEFEWSTLSVRAEDYPYPVPYGVLCLTAGVDTQPDRLEAEIVGWNQHMESWNIDYLVIYGDPDVPPGQPDSPWDELVSAIRERGYRHACGYEMRVYATAVDSGGRNTTAVYNFCKGRKAQRIFAIKGVSGENVPIAGTPNRKQTGKSKRPVDLYPVGVDQAKASLYRRFQIEEPGKPGYCHFPRARTEDYFKQITSETVVTTFKKGFPKREWTLPSGQRNEALDARVYATAALAIVRPPWDRFLKIREDALKQLSELPIGAPGGRPEPSRGELTWVKEPSAEGRPMGPTPEKAETPASKKTSPERRRRRPGSNYSVSSW